MMLRAVYIGTALVAVVSPFTRGARAQAPDCPYDRCALRVQSRLAGERIVQGIDATPVASIGLFAPRVEPLATAADSARVHYQAFRRYHNRGTPFTALALAAGVGAATLYLSNEDRATPDAAWALLSASVLLAIIGGTNDARGRDHLHQAIWFYNRSTSMGNSIAAEHPSGCTYDACALRMRRTLFSNALVHGSSAEPVARLGLFPPVIRLLAEAGDSSRHHYTFFRHQYTRGATLNIVGLVFAAASGILHGSDPTNRGVANALLFTGLAIGVGGSLSRENADGHLQQAIWFYNRSLSRLP